MKPSELKDALTVAAEAMRPTFVWGGPGIGKSQIMQQVADSLSMALIDLRVLLLDPVDFRGLPSVQQGVTRWNPPSFLPRAGQGILFLDELNAASPSIQASCYQLVQDRAIGEYKLPDGWVVFAAGNRESDGAVTSRMPTPLRNRFLHLELEPDPEEWAGSRTVAGWAPSNGIHPLICAFIRAFPQYLYSFSRDSKAFPTPRSWSFLSQLLDIWDKRRTPRNVQHVMTSGTIGDSAVEFSAWLRTYQDLPDMDALIANPDKAPVSKDPAVLYAICASLSRKLTVTNAPKVIKYLDRVPAEFGVMAMKDALLRDKALHSVSAVTQWAVRNQDVIF